MEQELWKFRQKNYLIIISLFLLIMIILIYYFITGMPRSDTTIVLAILSTILGIFSAMSTFLYKNPTTLSISLLGFPQSGKTVFITVLFNELMIKTTPGITFSSYGSETVEKFTSDLNTLRHGYWLPPTKYSEVFFYRAKALVGTGLSKRHFKIEISDYAGEHMKEFDPTDENWLHKTEYFKYVVESDAILISIDSETIMKAIEKDDIVTISVMESSFIAALQILIEKKGVDFNKKLQAPIALTFMKCDLLPRHILLELPKTFPNLINFCNRRCSNYKIFLTSSVGHVKNDGSPPENLEPSGVLDPINWILHKSE